VIIKLMLLLLWVPKSAAIALMHTVTPAMLLLLQVPEACMYDTVGEFLACPEVAYTQHYTTPFDEQCRNYW
jgi:hypothetical protein